MVVIMSVAVPALAQGEEDAETPEWAEEGRNSAGIFLGGAFRGDEVGLSIGADYEYRVSRQFGAGAVAEFTTGDIREGILGAGLAWHAWRELKIIVAPGVEFELGDRPDKFIMRIGGDYGFPLKETGYEIKPAFYCDIADGEVTYVVGALFGRSF